jgi:hypothetical protein
MRTTVAWRAAAVDPRVSVPVESEVRVALGAWARATGAIDGPLDDEHPTALRTHEISAAIGRRG